MSQLAEVAKKNSAVPAAQDGRKQLQSVIKSQMGKIMAVAPKHLSEDRLYQLTISAINHEPKLMQCDVTTLLSCVMRCSALGLEPSAVDGLGRAYILPYRNKKRGIYEATFILGYKGMLDLARRSGEIKSIEAHAVYDGDAFEYEFGLNETLRHKPSGRERLEDEKPTHVYMIAHFKDGGHYMDVMTLAEIEAVRERSAAGNSGPWVTDFEAMAKKTVIRRAFPYLPVSVEAQSAIAADGTSGGYNVQLESDTIFAEGELPVEDNDNKMPDTEPKGLKQAVCTVCGNQIDVAVDATIDDLNASMPCCETPSYQFVEGDE